MLTNNGLVAYVLVALMEKWGYVWGTFGQILTESLLNYKLRQYPTGVGNYEKFIRDTWLGKKTADCIGLIKSYMWNRDGLIIYDSNSDTTADGMYSMAMEKGPISSMPEIPGLCLWKPGHIGVYIGNGEVIEARGTMQGVIKSSLSDNNPGWTHWLKCPFITYEDGVSIGLRRGSIGDPVKALQTKLNKLGYSLVVDGDFGPATEKAVVNFQTNNNLAPDGEVDEVTMSALDGMIAKLEKPKKTFEDIVREISDNGEDWISKVDIMQKAAEADGDLGAFEICKYFKTLVVKAYYHK